MVDSCYRTFYALVRRGLLSIPGPRICQPHDCVKDHKRRTFDIAMHTNLQMHKEKCAVDFAIY